MKRKVRTWQSMADEYGVNKFGSIRGVGGYPFVPEMQGWCAREIELVANICDDWIFEEWMLEPLTPSIEAILDEAGNKTQDHGSLYDAGWQDAIDFIKSKLKQ